MASKKDLVEAYSFSRRRLVTAFVSGAPGGREVEPHRPGRSILGGIALSVLLVAGAAIAGVFKAPTEIDWDQPMLISESESGALYVNLPPADGGDPELRQVINITSARLLLGSDVDKTDIAREEIAGQDKLGPVGILQAPQTPPITSELVETGWTGCTGTDPRTGGELGTRIRVASSSPVTPTPGRAALVRTGRTYWLVMESAVGSQRQAPRAYAYEVPDEPGADSLVDAVAGVTLSDAERVDRRWLELFPRGGTLELEGFDLDGFGDPVPDGADLPDGAAIGDRVQTATGDVFVLTEDGLMRLDPFGAAVYGSLSFSGGQPRTYTPDQAPPSLPQSDTDGYADNRWPTDVVTDDRPVGEVCALLDTVADGQPGVRLATTFEGPASASGVDAGEVVAEVEPGAGALVRAGTWDLDGATTVTLLDEQGAAYPVADELALTNLGYAGLDDVVVPNGWIAPFADGVVLSVEAARCPPTSVSPAPSPDGCRA